MARAMEPFDLFWVEIDTRYARALRTIREARRSRSPPANACSAGATTGRSSSSEAIDVAIIDTPWNGIAESLKIAAMADAYEVNVAPHNFYGHLATMMNAHFCALCAELQDHGDRPRPVPWYDDLVTVKPRIEAGFLLLPDGPGWGTEVDEAAVRAHPPTGRLARRSPRPRDAGPRRAQQSAAVRAGATSGPGPSCAARKSATRSTTAGSRRIRR